MPPQQRGGIAGGGPGKGFLTDTRWGNEGWIGGELQMPKDLLDHLALHDGRDDPQRPSLTPRAACHIQGKDALEQPCPAPARRRRAVFLLLHALLARRGDDGPTQVAMGRQTVLSHFLSEAICGMIALHEQW
ncbi:MAG: hypothetical protein AB7N91_31330 [Candidatus Tectimicrobiota bacterium]